MNSRAYWGEKKEYQTKAENESRDKAKVTYTATGDFLHQFFVWSAHDAHNLFHLIDVVQPTKERLARFQFNQNARHWPHVD